MAKQSGNEWMRRTLQLLLLLAIGVFGIAQPIDAADDDILFTEGGASDPPNAVFMLDTSGSMRTVIFHAAYAEDAGSDSNNSCKPSGGKGAKIDADETITLCDRGVDLYYDPEMNIGGLQAGTWYTPDYLQWLADPKTLTSEYEAKYSGMTDPEIRAAIWADLASEENTYSCLGVTKYKYQMTRTTTAKFAIKEMICQLENGTLTTRSGDSISPTALRYGYARFSGKKGGYAVVPAEAYGQTYKLDILANAAGSTDLHQNHFDTQLDATSFPNSTSPLEEGLVQVYSYFYDRVDIPSAEDLNTDLSYECTDCAGGASVCQCDVIEGNSLANKTQDYPVYHAKSGDASYGEVTDWQVLGSPVTSPCQSHYVIYLTDGSDKNETGSMNQDGGIADSTSGFNLTGFWNGVSADDVTGIMYATDMFPDDVHSDMLGVQNVSTYVIGYDVADADIQEKYEKMAAKGGGEFYNAADSDKLIESLIDVVKSIIEGSQSFAASSVPSSRQSLGSYFYTSFFDPKPDEPFWEGHLMALNMSRGGGIFDKNWDCSLANTDPTVCRNGTLEIEVLKEGSTLVPVFDVANEVPEPASRTLYVGETGIGFGTYGSSIPEFTFDASGASGLSADELGLPASGWLTDGYKKALERDLGKNSVSQSDAEAFYTSGSFTRDVLTNAIVDYARGCDLGTAAYFGGDCVTRLNEDGAKNLIGDVFHSAPHLVTAPNGFGLGASYKSFRTDVKWRPLMIYVGANDGFLHAFNAGDWKCDNSGTVGSCAAGVTPDVFVPSGVEQFAFMPWTIREKVAQLSVSHGYYVDGSPVSRDVWINRQVDGATKLPTGSRIPGVPTDEATNGQYRWRTVMMGGLRQGGSSYYALDITDPDSSNYPGYLWEFPCEIATGCSNPGAALRTSGGTDITKDGYRLDAYLGQTWSDPVIHRVRVKVTSDNSLTVDRWVAIFGGGYDTAGDPRSGAHDAADDASTSRTGRAIFMVDIATGEILASRRFYHSNIGDGSLGDTVFDSNLDDTIYDNRLRYSFASSPLVDDEDGDGYIDTIYIGDLGGNLWRWDVSARGTDLAADGSQEAQTDWPLTLFFQSGPSTGARRSFYYPPVVAATEGSSDRWLVMATGNRSDIKDSNVTNDDTDAADNDRVYAIKDVTNIGAGSLPLDEDDLDDRTTITCADGEAVEDCEDRYESLIDQSAGYYFIADEDERFVSEIVVLAEEVTVGSFLPKTQDCVQSGFAFYWKFNLATSFGTQEGSTIDPEGRKKTIGVGMPRDPRPSFGSSSDGTCTQAELTAGSCSCDDKGPCCLIPDGGWSTCDAVCGSCSMVLGGASAGGSSAGCSSCKSSFLPRLRSWRQE